MKCTSILDLRFSLWWKYDLSLRWWHGVTLYKLHRSDDCILSTFYMNCNHLANFTNVFVLALKFTAQENEVLRDITSVWDILLYVFRIFGGYILNGRRKILSVRRLLRSAIKNKQVTIFTSIRLETKDVRAHARFQLSSEYILFNPLKRTDKQRKPKMV
jgi:hypothetical protein